MTCLISIHAPRVGSDRISPDIRLGLYHFNPRSPCGERLLVARPKTFDALDFNPRSPCGERRFYIRSAAGTFNFNPRSPCGERHLFQLFIADLHPFQSTLPVWGATGLGYGLALFLCISIHAPRVGSDEYDRLLLNFGELFQSTLPVWGATQPRPSASIQVGYFNPRSPCGERPYRLPASYSTPSFQSTLPVWGATQTGFLRKAGRHISIHAPRVGSDFPFTLR